MHGDAGFGRDRVNLVAEPLEFFSFAAQGVDTALQLLHGLEESGTHLVFGYERAPLAQHALHFGRGDAFLGRVNHDPDQQLVVRHFWVSFCLGWILVVPVRRLRQSAPDRKGDWRKLNSRARR
jgi:hypothetical protein